MFKFLLIAALALPSFTYPFGKRDDLHVGDFQAAGPNDLRSPCPGLNTLANHGYIPRDGKMLNPQVIAHGFKAAFNVGEMGITAIAKAGFKQLSATPTAVSGTNYYTLADLNEHDKVEHDASLTREDDYFHGDSHTKNVDRINKFLQISKDGQVITNQDMAAYREQLAEESQKSNPKFLWDFAHRFPAYMEASLTLNVLGRDGQISVADASSFFKDERIPADYQRSTEQLSLFKVIKGVLAITADQQIQDFIKNDWLPFLNQVETLKGKATSAIQNIEEMVHKLEHFGM